MKVRPPESEDADVLVAAPGSHVGSGAVLSRGTGRTLCRRYRFTDTTSLFASVADALQARVHQTAGFG